MATHITPGRFMAFWNETNVDLNYFWKCTNPRNVKFDIYEENSQGSQVLIIYISQATKLKP